MLGRTAGNLYWMFRYVERMEDTARLVDAGFQISLSHSSDDSEIWQSLIVTAGAQYDYETRYDNYDAASVIDYLLRDQSHPHSARSMLARARENGRAARTALTSEVWEALNKTYLDMNERFRRPISMRELPNHLREILVHSQQMRGALHGTMLRNDIYDFLRIGNFIERFEYTARILDVKYYVFLPSVAHVGSSIDSVQWETILRSVSAHQSYRWLHQGRSTAAGIANFLILDHRFPRSMIYSLKQNHDHLTYLSNEYGASSRSLELVGELREFLNQQTIDGIFDHGLHEFLQDAINMNAGLAAQIETDFRFYG